ncbi:MAG TPA: hypothetical protein VKM55_24240 [Candidatus Lokiarchaeia archaeon]|nr:hypothetical protein [Candidatus Lokiarchaeia archaeon]
MVMVIADDGDWDDGVGGGAMIFHILGMLMPVYFMAYEIFSCSNI